MALGMSETEINSTGFRGTNEGDQMKTNFGWENDGNGSNSSGFSGLPSGGRGELGIFYDAGAFGVWWSSTQPNSTSSWNRSLWGNELVARGNANNRFGFSVRCTKDAE